MPLSLLEGFEKAAVLIERGAWVNADESVYRTEFSLLQHPLSVSISQETCHMSIISALFGGKMGQRRHMRKKSFHFVLFGIFVILLGITSCKKGSGEQKTNEQDQIQASGYPVTIQGSDGKTVTLEEEPKKIISVSPNMTEIICSLGKIDSLAARTMYCDYPAEVMDIPEIGDIYSPDIEKIIELEPNLVMTSLHFSEEHAQLLETAGIKVLYLYEEHSYEGVYDIYEIFGKLFNIPDVTTDIIDGMKQDFQSLTEKLKDVEKKTVYYVVGYGEYGDYTAGGDSYVHQLLTLAGGDNVASEAVNWTYSVEKLLEDDPDYVIVPETVYQDFIAMPPYNELRAVKEGNVIAVDQNMLDRQTNRNCDVVYQIAEAMYPELF